MFEVQEVRMGKHARVLGDLIVEVKAKDGNGSEIYATSMHTSDCGGIEHVIVGSNSQYDACMREEEDAGEYADVEYCEGEMTGECGEYAELINVARGFMKAFIAAIA